MKTNSNEAQFLSMIGNCMFVAILPFTIWMGGSLLNPSAIAASCAEPRFEAARGINSTSFPNAVATADLNGDGKFDIVTPNNTSTGTISVLLADGFVSFASNVNYAAGSFPSTVQLGDINGDGTNDVAVLSADGAHTVRFFVNNGAGVFSSSTNLTGTSASVMFLANLDGDTVVDLITDGETRLNNGTGTFGTPSSLPTSGLTVLAVGDMNADGKNDLVVGSPDTLNPALGVELNNGNGTFQPAISNAVGPFTSKAGIGDFDGDGTNDVVTIDFTAGTASIYLNDGTGALQFHATYATGTNPANIVVGHFNNDNKDDIAVVNTTSHTVSILIATGSGNFQVRNYDVGTAPVGIAIGDYNDDGTADLAVSDTNFDQRANVFILLGRGDGTFEVAINYNTGHGPHSPQAADFNGDGFADLIVANAFSNNVSLLLNNGDGTLGTKVDYPAGKSPDSIAIADFNNDGTNDIAVANQNTNAVSLLLGKGNGTFFNTTTVGFSLGGSSSVLAGRFNGDANMDVAVIGFSTNFQTGVLVFLGTGFGTFASPVVTAGPLTGDIMASGFFNSDTNLDLVTGRPGTNAATVMLGNGNGSFQSPVTYTAGTNLSGLAVGDFNGDNKADIVTANLGCNSCGGTLYPHGSISVLFGNGNGTFQTAVNFMISPGGSLLAVKADDFNGDGIDDVAATDIIGTVWVLLGRADKTFEKPVQLGVQNSPYGVVAADLDGDQRPDLAVANQAVDTVSVLLNNCLFDVVVPTNSADLAISKTDTPDPVTIGSNLTYTVTVTNLGPIAATGIVLTDTLPSSAAFVSASTGCTNINGTVTCAIADLGNGEFDSVQIVVTPSTAGSITNTATVAGNVADSASGNNTATAITTVQQSGGSGGASLVGTLGKVKDKCKTKNSVTTCKLGAGLALLNNGNADASATHVRFFLSTDVNYDNGVDTLLGEATTKTIKPGKSGKGKLKAVTGASSAGQFILAVDDDDNVLASFQVPAV